MGIDIFVRGHELIKPNSDAPPNALGNGIRAIETIYHIAALRGDAHLVDAIQEGVPDGSYQCDGGDMEALAKATTGVARKAFLLAVKWLREPDAPYRYIIIDIQAF
jgi:hypothetical protein